VSPPGNFGSGSDWLRFGPGGTQLVAAVPGTSLGNWTYQDWDIAGQGARLAGQGRLLQGTPAAISPDGGTFAVTTTRNSLTTVQLWNSRTGRITLVTADQHENPGSVAFNPSGTMLAIGDNQGTLLWSLTAQRAIGRLPATAGALSAAFASDGATLAAYNYDNTIQLWNLASRLPFGPVMTSSTDGAAMAFSPDGSILAVAGGRTELWDVATGRLIGTLPDPDGSTSVDFSPNGATLAVGTSDGPDQLWNVGFLLPSRTPGYLCQQAGQTLTRRQWALDAPGVPYVNVCPGNPGAD
jgi:WD40 repeat protein